ncbi:MAG: hypothetical protein K0Q53_1360 [Massilibacillus sp.]|nr:hypothetical protein [Massilibacillus sp.]
MGYPYELEATPRFELGNRGFADLCLTTWLCRQTLFSFPIFASKESVDIV